MMNAGSSPAGRQFAIQYSDMHFDAITNLEDSRARIAETKRLARAHGRAIQVWTPVGIVCRPTQQEADAYMQRVIAHADWGAIGYLRGMQAREGRAPTTTVPNQVARRILARGAYCVIGDPDTVAEELCALHAIGFDGLAINFVAYLAELPYFAATVLPRLEQQGLRVPVAAG